MLTTFTVEYYTSAMTPTVLAVSCLVVACGLTSTDASPAYSPQQIKQRPSRSIMASYPYGHYQPIEVPADYQPEHHVDDSQVDSYVPVMWSNIDVKQSLDDTYPQSNPLLEGLYPVEMPRFYSKPATRYAVYVPPFADDDYRSMYFEQSKQDRLNEKLSEHGFQRNNYGSSDDDVDVLNLIKQQAQPAADLTDADYGRSMYLMNSAMFDKSDDKRVAAYDAEDAIRQLIGSFFTGQSADDVDDVKTFAVRDVSLKEKEPKTMGTTTTMTPTTTTTITTTDEPFIRFDELVEAYKQRYAMYLKAREQLQREEEKAAAIAEAKKHDPKTNEVEQVPKVDQEVVQEDQPSINERPVAVRLDGDNLRIRFIGGEQDNAGQQQEYLLADVGSDEAPPSQPVPATEPVEMVPASEPVEEVAASEPVEELTAASEPVEAVFNEAVATDPELRIETIALQVSDDESSETEQPSAPHSVWPDNFLQLTETEVNAEVDADDEIAHAQVI